MIIYALFIGVIMKIGFWVWFILKMILKRRLAATDANLAVAHFYENFLSLSHAAYFLALCSALLFPNSCIVLV